jgi:hypothetical protein
MPPVSDGPRSANLEESGGRYTALGVARHVVSLRIPAISQLCAALLWLSGGTVSPKDRAPA